MNTGGDVELAMELLMDDEVPEVEAPDVDDVEAFPTLGGGVGTVTTETEPEPLPTKIYLSGGRSNVNKASTMLNNWQTNGHASSGTSRTSKVERGVSSGTKTKIEWVKPPRCHSCTRRIETRHEIMHEFVMCATNRQRTHISGK